MTGRVLAVLRTALGANVVTRLSLRGKLLEGSPCDSQVGRTGAQARLAGGAEATPECQRVMREVCGFMSPPASTLYCHPAAQNFPSPGQLQGFHFRLLRKKDTSPDLGDSHGAHRCQDGVFRNPFSLDLSLGLRDLGPFNLWKMKVFC